MEPNVVQETVLFHYESVYSKLASYNIELHLHVGVTNMWMQQELQQELQE